MRRASSRGRPRIFMLPYRGVETSRLAAGTKGRCKSLIGDGVIGSLILTMESRAQMIMRAGPESRPHPIQAPKSNKLAHLSAAIGTLDDPKAKINIGDELVQPVVQDPHIVPEFPDSAGQTAEFIAGPLQFGLNAGCLRHPLAAPASRQPGRHGAQVRRFSVQEYQAGRTGRRYPGRPMARRRRRKPSAEPRALYAASSPQRLDST